MLRRTFLAAASSAFTGAKPNVLFILTDDQRADYLGCMGHPIVKTPHIDALASRGTLFRNAFATSPICTPSRTCYLLGQWERKHGINFNSQSSVHPDAFALSYPALLRKAGYFTGYVGKNHTPVGAGGYTSGHIERQFDYWYGNHGHIQFYPKDRHPVYRNAKSATQPEVLLEGASGFLTPDDQFLAAGEFLKRRPSGVPFALTLCFNLPHSASTNSMRQLPGDPALYRTAYRDQAGHLRLPETYVAANRIASPKIPRDVYSGQFIPSYSYVKTPETMREMQIRTCQTVTGIDNVAGSLIEQLRRLGLEQNTVILFASDHGLFHGEHGLGGKALLYEESIHIPMIVYDPRIASQVKESRQFVVPADIAPTILSLCGERIPASMQGRPITPLLRGNHSGWRNDVFCENLFTDQEYPRVECVRDRDWKYIRYFRRFPQGGNTPYPYAETLDASIRGEQPVYEELFHLKEDPREQHNFAASRPPILDSLRRRCNQLVKEAKGASGAPWTLPATESRLGAG
ncbi:MAG: sulfatase-like hydrolase/transferase [Bryobacterales bacterium]|nr:sulfatase-like hydrolase/transferase [Bryobacterales bacterium]